MTIDYQVGDTVVYYAGTTGAAKEFIGHRALVLEVGGNIYDPGVTRVEWESPIPFGTSPMGWWDGLNFRKVDAVINDGDYVEYVGDFTPEFLGKKGFVTDSSDQNNIKVDAFDFRRVFGTNLKVIIPAGNFTKKENDVTTNEVEALKAEVERLTALSQAYKDQNDRTNSAWSAARDRADKSDLALQSFRKQVAEYVTEKREEEEICQSGYEDFMNEMGLDEFMKKPFSITVTLTISSSDIDPDLNRDNLDDDEVAAIIYSMAEHDLAASFREFEVNDEDQ